MASIYNWHKRLSFFKLQQASRLSGRELEANKSYRFCQSMAPCKTMLHDLKTLPFCWAHYRIQNPIREMQEIAHYWCKARHETVSKCISHQSSKQIYRNNRSIDTKSIGYYVKSWIELRIHYLNSKDWITSITIQVKSYFYM